MESKFGCKISIATTQLHQNDPCLAFQLSLSFWMAAILKYCRFDWPYLHGHITFLEKPALQFRGRVYTDVILPLFYEKFCCRINSLFTKIAFNHVRFPVISLEQAVFLSNSEPLLLKDCTTNLSTVDKRKHLMILSQISYGFYPSSNAMFRVNNSQARII